MRSPGWTFGIRLGLGLGLGLGLANPDLDARQQLGEGDVGVPQRRAEADRVAAERRPLHEQLVRGARLVRGVGVGLGLGLGLGVGVGIGVG